MSRSRGPSWKERSRVRPSCCPTAGVPRQDHTAQGPFTLPGKELLAARVHGVAGRAEVGRAEEGYAVAHLRWHVKETWGRRAPGWGSRGSRHANPTPQARLQVLRPNPARKSHTPTLLTCKSCTQDCACRSCAPSHLPPKAVAAVTPGNSLQCSQKLPLKCPQPR